MAVNLKGPEVEDGHVICCDMSYVLNRNIQFLVYIKHKSIW
jgi:hypothetical protein